MAACGLYQVFADCNGLERMESGHFNAGTEAAPQDDRVNGHIHRL
jgi:hypothetical protein